MLYPENIEEKLGFDKLRQMLLGKCISSMGREYASQMRWSHERATVQKWLGQADEFMRLISTDKPFPADNYTDARGWLQKGIIDGALLSEEEFHQLRALLKTLLLVGYYFKEKKESYPLLTLLCEGINPNENNILEIDRKIDEHGQVKPSASKELMEISRKLDEYRQQVRRKVISVAKQIAENGWGPESAPSLRDGRLTVALHAEHKRKVQGYMHDESSTGQTVYIEPAEVFEMNNLLRELELDRVREIRKILIDLTTVLRPDFQNISNWCQRLGLLDFIRAKALLGIELKAICPDLLERPGMEWLNARHPLLYLHHKKQNKQVIPLSIILNKDERIIVISGPNAGGKSVLLKTVGLLQLMLQHGLPVPCKLGSRVGLFQNMFIDIGDEQSIDNDLSTYSSHLANMRHFMRFANSRTMFLIDEFGTGTDPQFGGPMAESILEMLNKKFSMGVVTTHYSNLKLFASKAHGVANGSMVFDNEALQPLYQFDPGKPGSSYTFEIAQKSGVEKEVIDKAKQKAGSGHNKVDKLLLELEREKTYLKNLREDTEKKEKTATENLTKYTELKTKLEAEEKGILKKAKNDALHILKEARQVVENTIREIKEAGAETAATKQIRQKMDKAEADLETQVRTQHVTSLITTNNVLQPGDHVRILSTNQTAEIVSISGKKANVMLGNIATRVALNDIVFIETQHVVSPISPRSRSGGLDLNEKLAHFNAEINVIGKRSDEALPEVLRFVDEAILLGFDRIRIVHGRGSGILKRMVRKELKRINSVKSYKDEQQEFGGDAITVVELA